MRYIRKETDFDALKMVRKVREELDDLWANNREEYRRQMKEAEKEMNEKLKAFNERKAKVA